MKKANQVTDVLFRTPTLGEPERAVLAQIEELKQALRWQLREPRRWTGSLRRAQFARAVQGSNSIEGFDASEDDAAAIDLGEEPLDADEETTRALGGYRDAMTFVLQQASEENFTYSETLLKSLHFMMTSYALKNRPGLWRAGAIYVRNDDTEQVVYEGPPIEQVAGLIGAYLRCLNQPDGAPLLVHAGMAHLNLVLIHPFRDGNGRMARCVQTLVLARDGVQDPVFSSIEEYLGRNTQAYYDVLADVAAGSWQPDRDTRPWVRFTLTAHLRQARTMMRRVKESERMWEEIERLVAERHLNERVIPLLWDAAIGYRVRNATYRASSLEAGEEMTEQSASRDLRTLSEAGLLVAHGDKRGRFYVAGTDLHAIRQAVVRARDPRDNSDPFALAG